MILMGKILLNESLIFAAGPMAGNPGKVFVVTTDGRDLQIPCSEADFFLAISNYLGLEQESPAVGFTDPELAELAEAVMHGYHYAAKDKTDNVFVFTVRPQKKGAYWQAEGGAKGSRRLTLSYEALAFEDEAPLFISDVLKWGI